MHYPGVVLIDKAATSHLNVMERTMSSTGTGLVVLSSAGCSFSPDVRNLSIHSAVSWVLKDSRDTDNEARRFLKCEKKMKREECELITFF